jgi:hypothetical protein
MSVPAKAEVLAVIDRPSTPGAIGAASERT